MIEIRLDCPTCGPTTRCAGQRLEAGEIDRPVGVPIKTGTRHDQPRQIEANRRNATSSTGPRTTRGKAVALNAVQHGLLSRQAVIHGESEAELVELGKRLRGQLAPMGELELLLADRIISTAWRLRRAIALEPRRLDTEHGDKSAYHGALTYKSDRDKLQLLSATSLPSSAAYSGRCTSCSGCRPSAAACRSHRRSRST